MSAFLAAFFSFLAATSLLVLMVLLAMAVQTSSQALIRKRLIAVGQKPYASRAEIRDLLRNRSYSEIPWLNRFLARLDFSRTINVLLERANLDITPGFFLLSAVLCGALLVVLLSLLGQSLSVAFLAGLLLSLVPYLYVKRLASKRLRRFLEQMPDGLDMISQGLQAGMGLTHAITFVAKEMPDPLGTEFSVYMEELNLGLPLSDSLKNLQERIPLQEVRLLSTAMMVQKEIGGSLGELLTKLADVIRDRFRIERQIKSLTAQNRISAWVVSSLPPFLAAFMYAMDKNLMIETWSNPIGKSMLLAAVGLELIGILVFRRFLRIHI